MEQLPPALQAALASGDMDRVEAALRDHFTPEEQRLLLMMLSGQEGLFGDDDMDGEDILAEFDDFLRAVAVVARGEGDSEMRQMLEEELDTLEEDDWHLRAPIHQFWEGERDIEVLTAGLDESDTSVIERLLEVLAAPSPVAVAASLPEDLRLALAEDDMEALQVALDALPDETSADLMEQMEAAGLISTREAPDDELDLDAVLQVADLMLRDIAEVARGGGDQDLREEIIEALPWLEKRGWQISYAIRDIWNGERDPAVLTADIDPQSAAMVQRILDLIEQPSQEEIIASLPSAVREAVESEDIEALRKALDALPEEETAEVIAQMRMGGIVS